MGSSLEPMSIVFAVTRHLVSSITVCISSTVDIRLLATAPPAGDARLGLGSLLGHGVIELVNLLVGFRADLSELLRDVLLALVKLGTSLVELLLCVLCLILGSVYRPGLGHWV